MEFQYILIIFSVMLKVVTSNFDLPEIIYEICPYSDICNRTASKSLNAKGMVPCCSSCKCDEKCGLRLDCCFDDLDKYRLEDRGIAACITPFTNDKNGAPFVGAYWMIKTCNYETENSSQTDGNIPCELYDETGKYLVEPVSSKETQTIYVNEKCAICNNVHNLTKWNYLILTPHKEVGPSVWENHSDHSDSSVYIPPKEENWSMKRCFGKFKETCNTNSTLNTLCHTLKAPFLHDLGQRFRNPFCVLCEQGNFKGLRKECKNEFGRTTTLPFTVLLDNSVIAPSKLHKNVMINRCLKPDSQTDVSVLSDLKEYCLPIYCPDGMLMTPAGCKYFINRWHIPAFHVQFKLWSTVGNELSVATLNALTLEELRNPALWMKIPCRRVKPHIIEVFYEIVQNKREIIKSFIVQLSKLTTDGIDPSVLLPTLQKCLKYNWKIKILGKAYIFRPTLDKHSTYIQDGKLLRVNKLTYNREATKRPQLYRKIATGPNSLHILKFARKIILLKTFFCDQINLPMEAVEVLFGEMRILSKNVTLGNNEFSINFIKTQNGDTDFNKTTFSVCVEDYDDSYDRWRSGNATSSRILSLEQLVILYMILYLIM